LKRLDEFSGALRPFEVNAKTTETINYLKEFGGAQTHEDMVLDIMDRINPEELQRLDPTALSSTTVLYCGCPASAGTAPS
jgi:hypothetical protein